MNWGSWGHFWSREAQSLSCQGHIQSTQLWTTSSVGWLWGHSQSLGQTSALCVCWCPNKMEQQLLYHCLLLLDSSIHAQHTWPLNRLPACVCICLMVLKWLATTLCLPFSNLKSHRFVPIPSFHAKRKECLVYSLYFWGKRMLELLYTVQYLSYHRGK